MHNRHEQYGFHFLILDLKPSKQERSFIKRSFIVLLELKKIVSGPYLNVLGTLLENSLRVLKLYCMTTLLAKAYKYVYKNSVAKVWIFLQCPKKGASFYRSS